MKLPAYRIADVERIPSPAVLIYRTLLEGNLDQMVVMAGSPDRLRPHCKTHKTREIIRLLLDRGVTRHKAATLREVEMCLEAGASDVLLAYQLVGPAVAQFAELAARWPNARLAALVDCDAHVDTLSAAARARGVTLGAMVDLDTGFHRTGLPVADAAPLYARVTRSAGLRAAGLHLYDAQNAAHRDPAERRKVVEQTLAPVLDLAASLQAAGHPVPEVLCGGSPTFPVYAGERQPPIVCSPGTAVFSDFGYGSAYSDLAANFTPAAVLLGRVISRPSAQHVTLDVGTKAIAADPPVGQRGCIIGLEDGETIAHNEEHWALASRQAERFRVGDPVLVVPTHVCPSINLHPILHVLDDEGRLVDRWEVVARQRAPVG